MCQRCHLRVDLKLHIENRIKNAAKAKHRQAGLTAAKTKGLEERTRAALMAGWTRKYGKDDSENPYSKQNFYPQRRLNIIPS
jgi:hypothetical protein